MVKAYTSAIQRLRALPEVFTGRDLTVRFQWTAALASTYLANWRKAGLVRSLGGHSDVHLNLVVRPEPRLELALRRILPEATRIGADILREAGWTTQILRVPQVAVHASSPRYQLVDFALEPRSNPWFLKVGPGVIDPKNGLRQLKPAWALADMMDRFMDRRVKHSWLLASDDIDLEAAASDPDAPAAIAAFGLVPGAFSPSAYSRVYDSREQDEAESVPGR